MKSNDRDYGSRHVQNDFSYDKDYTVLKWGYFKDDSMYLTINVNF